MFGLNSMFCDFFLRNDSENNGTPSICTRRLPSSLLQGPELNWKLWNISELKSIELATEMHDLMESASILASNLLSCFYRSNDAIWLDF